MLILSRREAERICLGDDIVLTIVAVGNDKVRIGVQAPSGIRILRNELERDKATVPFQVSQSESTTTSPTETKQKNHSGRQPGPLSARTAAGRKSLKPGQPNIAFRSENEENQAEPTRKAA